MSKPVTPYQRLLKAANEYRTSVQYASTRTMWTYPADKIQTESWGMFGLAQRVAAADSLGWDVKLRLNADGGLAVIYVKRPMIPEFPE